ncbi:hypothetical protein NE287_05950 [Pediococcus pentosaceus]|uniref:hypothetical protein n=1 Tax=Pediococcus pentosaceus TaxID=1255 RepID=UPI00207317B7|nr:hypothetical protein [Pediococcus pentosaceus]MCM6810309.1 hypothetical protein [Pediococcus pentosaceus]
MADLVFNHKIDVANRKELLRLTNIITPNENKRQQEARNNDRIRREFEDIPFRIK